MNVKVKQLHGVDVTASMPTNVTDGYETKQLGFSEEDVIDPYDPALPNDYVDVVRDRKEAWRNREMSIARNEKLKVGKSVPCNNITWNGDILLYYLPFFFLFFNIISFLMYVHPCDLCISGD